METIKKREYYKMAADACENSAMLHHDDGVEVVLNSMKMDKYEQMKDSKLNAFCNNNMHY